MFGTSRELRQLLTLERVPPTAVGVDVVSLLHDAFAAAVAAAPGISMSYHDEEHINDYFDSARHYQQHVYPYCSIADVANCLKRVAKISAKAELFNGRLIGLFSTFIECNRHTFNGIAPTTTVLNLRDPGADIVLRMAAAAPVDVIANKVPKGVAAPRLTGNGAPEWTYGFFTVVLPDTIGEDTTDFLIHPDGQVRLHLQVGVDNDGHIFQEAPVHRVNLVVEQWISRPAQTAGGAAWEGWHSADQTCDGAYFVGDIHSVVIYPISVDTTARP